MKLHAYVLAIKSGILVRGIWREDKSTGIMNGKRSGINLKGCQQVDVYVKAEEEITFE